MAQKKKKTAKKHGILKVTTAVVLILLALFIISFLIWHFTHPETDEIWEQGIHTVSSGELSVDEQKGLSFPYTLADGKLEVTSIFQYSGGNPDCDDEMGENIAALAVVNKSDKHLSSAQFTAVLLDGTQIPFEVTDIPAGQTVWAFAKDNSVYETENVCESLTCTAQFEDISPLMADKLSFEVNETEVTFINNSGESLSNLSVSCHCLFEDAYFGGRTYTYPIENIAAGEKLTVSAEDCYLGKAAVVRINQDN